MANRETSDAISSLAAKVLATKPRDGDEHLSFNALLVQAKRLAGSALAQDETPGLRQAQNAADPRRNDYHPDDTPIQRLEKIAGNMKACADHYVESDSPEAFGYTLEATYQFADHIGEAVKMLQAPSAGTSAYEMMAAQEQQHVEVTETLIHMVAATVLMQMIERQAPVVTSGKVRFSPSDMDRMHRDYIMHASRAGMLTVVSVERRPETEAMPPLPPADAHLEDRPESLMRQDEPETPFEPQAEHKEHDRPLWAARIDGVLHPRSDREAAERAVTSCRPDQIAQIENRFCYHPDCPAEHCNHVPDQDGAVEATSGS